MSKNNQYLELEKLVENSLRKTNLKANFTYETKDSSFNFLNGEGFILKNEFYNFKYPFVEETFKDFFLVRPIMNILIKKENDLKKLVEFKYDVENNNIDLFNLFTIKVLEDKILISYIDYSVLIDIEYIKCVKYVEEKLIFQFKNAEDVMIKRIYNKIFNFDLYVYREGQKSYLQEVKIYLSHDIFFTKLVQIINDIIGVQLEKMEEIQKNKIKIIQM